MNIAAYATLLLNSCIIHYGSAIKMHKCIFAALTLQVFVLNYLLIIFFFNDFQVVLRDFSPTTATFNSYA